MASIFISYRRVGALVHARALFERLRNEFGPGEVFIDLEGIEYGVDFVDILNKQLNGCQVMMAIIDPHWATAADKQGRRRIDREYDYVRTEIVTALARGIRTVPVLIDGAEMPDAADLPVPLRPLTRRNALMLDFNRFDAQTTAISGTVGNSTLVSVSAQSLNQVYVLEEEDILQFLNNHAQFRVFSTNDGGLTWITQIPLTGSDYLQSLPGKIATNGSGDVVVAGQGYLSTYTPSFGWDTNATTGALITNEAVYISGGSLAGDFIAGLSLSPDSKSAWIADISGNISEEIFSTLGAKPHPGFSNWQVILPATVDTPQNQFGGIAAFDSSDAVVVGPTGLLACYSASAAGILSPVSQTVVPTSVDLNAISLAATAGSAWAVGSGGTVIEVTPNGPNFCQGLTVTAHNYPDTTVTLNAVSASPDGTNIWVVGSNPSGALIMGHSANGGSWSSQVTGITAATAVSTVTGNDASSVASVSAADPSTVWIVGANGTILKTATAGNTPTPNN